MKEYLFIGLCASMSCQLWGILDVDQNGVSDVYESHYGFQVDPSSSNADYHLQGDFDKDEHSNQKEAVFGTDPTDASVFLNSSGPAGKMTQEVSLLPSGDFEIRFWTLLGKKYWVQSSGDLSAWTDVDAALPGLGQLEQITILSAFLPDYPEGTFFRVKVEDVYTDADLLTDWEELQVGTDPNVADSDGDKADDYEELFHGLDPLLYVDQDGSGQNGDGLSDDWELVHFGDLTTANGDFNAGPLTDSDSDGWSDLSEFQADGDVSVPDNASVKIIFY